MSNLASLITIFPLFVTFTATKQLCPLRVNFKSFLARLCLHYLRSWIVPGVHDSLVLHSVEKHDWRHGPPLCCHPRRGGARHRFPRLEPLEMTERSTLIKDTTSTSIIVRHGVLPGHREELRAGFCFLPLLALCAVVLGFGEGYRDRHPLVPQKRAEVSLPSAAGIGCAYRLRLCGQP